MGGVYRAGFEISGDAAGAIAAVKDFGNKISSMSKRFDTLAKHAETSSQKSVEALKVLGPKVTGLTTRINHLAEAYERLVKQATLLEGKSKRTPIPSAPTQGAVGSGGVAPIVSAGVDNASAGFTRLNKLTSVFGINLKETFGKNASNIFSGFSKNLTNLSFGMGNMLNSLRLIGQGITNAGRSMFFFVSLPLAAFIAGMTKTAIDFDDAMIRVRKTANLTRRELGQLTEHLRKLARAMAMSHVELAGIAEVIGQAGVTSVKSIGELTEVFAMLAITTDLTADQAANSMVKIANAFMWNLNKSTDEVWRLANVVNMLENETAASAAEIVNSLAKWSQVASTLKITTAEAAALSASLISMGVSDDEAAIGLKNLGIYLGRNAALVSELLGQNKKYSTTQAAVNAINDDAVGVFLDLADAMSKQVDEGKNIEALVASMEIGNLRGGRALAALSQNILMVAENLRKANSEWRNANSLAREYAMAMESTKNQTQVFKNNAADVGITVGKYILPYVNQLVQVAIPALQMLGQAFENLTAQQKYTAVAIVGVVLVAGPLILFFGQLFHAVMLVALGSLMLIRSFASFVGAMGGMFGAIGKIRKGFGLLGTVITKDFIPKIIKIPGAIASIIAWAGRVAPAFLSGFSLVAKGALRFLGWPALILTALMAVLKVLVRFGVDVSGFFIRLGQSAVDWGNNLAEQISVGFLAGAVRYVSSAIQWVANLIASFFEGHSPPEAGPLSSIDKWGSAVLQAYLDGFTKADFSVLEDIGGKIEQILTRGVENEALPAALEAVAKARVDLAQLIEKFNSEGVIDTGLLDTAVSGLGDMADEMAELVRLNLEYNNLQKALDDIEKQRKGINDAYKQEVDLIAASNMSVEEKVAAMRKAQRSRDSGLYALTEEEQKLEDQKDSIQEQRDLMDAMVNTMLKQDDLWTRILDKLDKVAGALGGGIDLELPEMGDGGFAGLGEEVEKINEKIRTFVEKIEEGKKALEGFFTGFAGGDKMSMEDYTWGDTGGIPTEEQAKSYGMYSMLYDLGAAAADVKTKFDELKAKYDELSTKVENFKTGVDNVKKSIQGFFSGAITFGGGVALGVSGAWTDIQTSLSTFGTNLKTGIENVGTNIKTSWENSGVKLALDYAWTELKPSLDTLGASLSTWWDSVGTLWDSLKENVLEPAWDTISTWFAGVDWEAIGNIVYEGLKSVPILGAFLNIFEELKKIDWSLVGEFLLSAIKNTPIAKTFMGVWSFLKSVNWGLVFSTMWEGIKTQFRNLLTIVWVILVQGAKTWITGISAIFSGGAEFNELLAKLLELGSGLVVRLGEGMRSKYEEVKAGARELVLGIKEGVEEKWAEIKETVRDKIEYWRNSIEQKGTQIRLAAFLLISKLKEGAEERWEAIKTFVGDKVEEWRQSIVSSVQNFVSIGSDLMQGLTDGVESKWNEVKGWFENIAKKVKAIFTGEWDINSPSGVFKDIAINAMLGLELGMDTGLGGVLSTAGMGAGLISDAMVPTFPYDSFYGGNETNYGGNLVVQVMNPVVREERDITRIVDEIERRLARKARNGAQLGRSN